MQVGKNHRTNGADYALESIHNIREALPMLWEANNKLENVSSLRKIAIETSVEAQKQCLISMEEAGRGIPFQLMPEAGVLATKQYIMYQIYTVFL